MINAQTGSCQPPPWMGGPMYGSIDGLIYGSIDGIICGSSDGFITILLGLQSPLPGRTIFRNLMFKAVGGSLPYRGEPFSEIWFLSKPFFR